MDDTTSEHLEKIGPYRILGTLGSGGMSVVYRAEQTSLEREVAVKVLAPESSQSPESIARFERESQLVANLSHPGIIQIIDCGELDGRYFIAMEYVKGCSLEDLLRERRLAVHEIVDIGEQVAQALQYAHSKGVVHRDIKPGNLLVSSESGTVKVADFGIAQLERAHHLTGNTITRANVGMGTIDYMAPEQRLNARDVDGRADIFSFGVVLYEMLTGRLPLGHFKPPEQHRDDTPPQLSKIVMRCLQESPQDRYADFGALADDLAEVTLVNVQYREALGRVAETVRRVSGKARTSLWERFRRDGLAGLTQLAGEGGVLRMAVGGVAVLGVVVALAYAVSSVMSGGFFGGPYSEEFERAEQLVEAGEPQAALEVLRAVRTAAGAAEGEEEWEAEAQWRVAGIHRERGSTQSAAIAYGYFAREFEADVQGDRLPEALYWAGHFREVKKKADDEGAAYFFGRVYEEFPNDPRAPEAMARTARLMQDELRPPKGMDRKVWYRNIAALHQRVIDEFPQSPARELAYFKLGELYEKRSEVRDYARSAANYEALARSFPASDTEPLYRAAQVVDRRLKDKPRAATLYERFAATQPGSKNASKARNRAKSLRR